MGVGVSVSEEDSSRGNKGKRNSTQSPVVGVISPKIQQKYASTLKTLIRNKALNLNRMSLTSIPDELLDILAMQLRVEDIEVRQAVLVNNKFRDFPWAAFLRMKELQVLKLRELLVSSSGMHNLEYNICADQRDPIDWSVVFPELEYFVANTNFIQRFPTSIGNCRNLVEVDIRSNPCIDPVEFVPFLSGLNVCNISSLKILKMGNCYNFNNDPEETPIHVPASLLELHQVSLQELELESNNIYSFCRDVDEPIIMHKLADLVLYSNELTELNPKVFNGACLPALKNLVLLHNKLTHLPEELCSILTMERIFLTQNRLKSLPTNIGKMTNLVHLECAENDIEELPESISQLTSLTYLDFTYNRLTSVPDIILSNLKKLLDLNLGGNKLSNETCSLALIGENSKKLVSLNLGYNQFTSIDDLFQSENSVARLDTLIVSGNRLESLPIQLSQKPRLSKLYAGYNQIKSLPPDFIYNMERVQHLSLFGNSLTDDIFPDRHDRDYEFTSIDLSHNDFAFSSQNALDFVRDVNTVIADVPLEFQSQFNKNVDETDLEVENNELDNRGSISSGMAFMRGERPSMEDSHVIKNNVDTGNSSIHVQLYCVFDGHSGDATANYVANNIASVLGSVFKDFTSYERTSNKQKADQQILRRTIERVDQDVKEKGLDDGCTAVIALIVDHVRCTVANIGDSRIVLVEQNHGVITGRRLTVDHKPTTISEKRRINKLDGVVHDGRINGYAVSRALGDHKERPFISSEPHITSIEINPAVHRFMILACDGVWDVVKDQQAAELVWDTWHKQQELLTSNHTKLSLCSSVLRDYAYALRSLDNISCIILKFNS